MDVKYSSLDHKYDFLEMRRNLPEQYRFSKECLSVIFLMAGNKELNQKLTPYFEGDKGEFETEKMFEEQEFCSSDLKTLAQLAVSLFNTNKRIDAQKLISLGKENFDLAINAIVLRKEGISTGYHQNSESF
ncbi:hypothetical protein ACFVL4_24390 [Bacillus subtilis]|uniref:Uncharacterized protein n=1 Tax=Bacillus subtilis TaxID=1423 RepID=A0A0D1IWX4_BACIU|nr:MULTISPECIES: hypothetical protein [Bacillus subtilis group]AVB12117.1 hypothetical protein C3438_21900 [Bacillus velezensis]AYK76567.1 hypothetical protein D9C12_22750 [Bacillus subtilis subsp. subtilis]AYL03197.1 hypothetical protein D9C08_22905 [Bacillus subtilis subsp. subtilis]KIU04479.1 hypothetical protein SC09_contig8orf00133 [Bacillus subtilis]MDK7656916.1 hypothetical protein [Bacillus subtilis]